MPPKISIAELSRICGFKSDRKFRQVLNNRGLSLKKTEAVSKRRADEIAEIFTGRSIDWMDIKRRQRDESSQGPLVRVSDASDSNAARDTIERWWRALESNVRIGERSEALLGVVVRGGHLRGLHGGELVQPLTTGLNVLIGRRGSGKSTLLDMLGLGSDSLSAESDALVTAILGMLNSTRVQQSDILRSAKNTMAKYSISELGLFTLLDGSIHCMRINAEKQSYAVAVLNRTGIWELTDADWVDSMPKALFLSQGEVVRIADKNDSTFVHQLLDTLHPRLHRARRDLAKQVAKIRERRAHLTSLPMPRADLRPIQEYCDLMRRQVDAIEVRDRDHLLTPEDAQRVWELVRTCRSAKSEYEDEPAFALLQLGGDALQFIWIRPIIGFLEDAVGATQHPTGSGSVRTDPRAPTAHLARDFLATRLDALRRLARVFAHGRIKCDAEISGLLKARSELLATRAEVLSLQVDRCAQVNERINSGHRAITFDSPEAHSMLASDQEEAIELQAASSLFEGLYAWRAAEPLSKFTDAAARYDGVVSRSVAWTDALGDDSFGKSQIYSPVSISYRADREERQFDKLSYGQKSGIILKLVLSTSERSVVLIDQPEDHLDADAILNILTPTLAEIARSTQVIIATHSANLALGLNSELPYDSNRMHVLMTQGDYGVLEMFGHPSEDRMIEAMLTVLEGGRETFARRMELYRNFLVLLTRHDPDADLAQIERYLRKRTIDGLRNFVQPVVSDAFLLRGARHDLKQDSVTRFTSSIESLRKEADFAADQCDGHAAIMTRIAAICEKLDAYIIRVTSAIDSLRMLETAPRPKLIDCGEFFHSLALAWRAEKGIDDDGVMIVEVAPDLFGVSALIDPRHFDLVVRSLWDNCRHSTELKSAELFSATGTVDFVQKISLALEGFGQGRIEIRLSDNGGGIRPDLIERLYKERCTTQGGDHGFGSLIVRTLLDINRGRIRVHETGELADGSEGTIQIITLPTGRR